MGKYQPLADYLRRQAAGSVSLTFGQIEEVVGSELPPSARAWSAWWANDATHVQARAWLGVGWRVSGLRLPEEVARCSGGSDQRRTR